MRLGVILPSTTPDGSLFTGETLIEIFTKLLSIFRDIDHKLHHCITLRTFGQI